MLWKSLKMSWYLFRMKHSHDDKFKQNYLKLLDNWVGLEYELFGESKYEGEQP